MQSGSGLEYVGFFFAVLGNVPGCCAASLSLPCRKQGSWGACSPGTSPQKDGALGLSCCCASVIIPTAVLHPCLCCCSHQDQSWLFITPFSAALCSHFRYPRKPSHRS